MSVALHLVATELQLAGEVTLLSKPGGNGHV